MQKPDVKRPRGWPPARSARGRVRFEKPEATWWLRQLLGLNFRKSLVRVPEPLEAKARDKECSAVGSMSPDAERAAQESPTRWSSGHRAPPEEIARFRLDVTLSLGVQLSSFLSGAVHNIYRCQKGPLF